MKKIFLLILCACFLLSMAGCSVKESSTDKLKDLEFTVLEPEKIPKELKIMIDEKKESTFKVTYSDKNYLYIAQGYGEKDTSGYSIEVAECYETKNAVYIHTNLIGPAKNEMVKEKVTYPYIVVKMEYNEKNVVFD